MVDAGEEAVVSEEGEQVTAPIKDFTLDDAESLGQLADTADNYREYGVADDIMGAFKTLPVEMRLEVLTHGLTEVRDALRSIYIAFTGIDVWGSDD